MTQLLDGLGVLVWNVLAFGLWTLAMVRVIRTPAERFEHGWRTKVGRLAVIECFGIIVAGLYLPFGAAAVLMGMRRAAGQREDLGLAAANGPDVPAEPGPSTNRGNR